MRYILGNHWMEASNGFITLKEEDQDITNTLRWDDNSVECLFTCHVQEHISLIENIVFFKEALRCLKIGGVLRIACPVVDKLIQFKNDEIGRHYSDIQTRHYYTNEDIKLKELGLDGIREEPIAFMLDSLFKGHNHKFIWTSTLLKKVLEKIGFSEVYICDPGETNFNKEYCLERIIRGVDPEYVKNKFNVTQYDPETLVVEAKK